MAKSIENKLFNNLDYDFDNEMLREIQDEEMKEKLKLWFGKPFLNNEPTNAVLFYQNKDCLATNEWIKNIV